MFASNKPEVRAGFGRMLLSLDLLPSAASLTVPAIVVGSRYDRLLPLWYSERLAEALPDVVEFVELTEVGHMSPFEEPERVTGLIGRLARACLKARPRTLETARARSKREATVMSEAPRTPEPNPERVTPKDVAEMSQGAPGEPAEAAGRLSRNAKRGRRQRKGSGTPKTEEQRKRPAR
jgi:hypothetical protein